MEKNNQKDKRKVSRTWNREEIRKLIELYEMRVDLWNPSSQNYMNRNIKQTLLSEIANELNVSSKDVSAKWHALRTQFNRECNKERTLKSGSGADEAYISKWEYKSSLRFLNVNTMSGATVSTLDLNELSSTGPIEKLAEFDINAAIVLSSDSSDTNDNQYDVPSCSNNKRRIEHSSKRKKSNSQSSDENVLMQKALEVMSHTNDELDVFGQFIASEMRQISDLSKRNSVKREIMAILMNSGNDMLITTTQLQPFTVCNNISPIDITNSDENKFQYCFE
ncbi:uncharacterized protein LOC116350192 [Contarinia nasturtii]|uniref:uncharacterized protein LOC116350192 n=1 Tax=Contarinia nasturtii TaxID=265458 RepID=UPI0012D497CE|nr:uncharacterized protein LOC116350192 [Contarinia nasturtii]